MRVLLLTNPLYKWKKRPRESRDTEGSEQHGSREYGVSGDLGFRVSCSHLRPIIWPAFTGVGVFWMPKPQWRLELSIYVDSKGMWAQEALLAVFCRMLHLNSIISAKNLWERTWDIILPRHPPNPSKLLKCSWNGRILMWSINPLLPQTLISEYK